MEHEPCFVKMLRNSNCKAWKIFTRAGTLQRYYCCDGQKLCTTSTSCRSFSKVKRQLEQQLIYSTIFDLFINMKYIAKHDIGHKMGQKNMFTNFSSFSMKPASKSHVIIMPCYLYAYILSQFSFVPSFLTGTMLSFYLFIGSSTALHVCRLS